MSYEEKGQWVYLVANTVTFGAYVAILTSFGRTPLTELDYVPTLLWTIAIAIGLSIVGRIAIEIAKPSDTYATDERDRDINRFGEYVGGTLLGLGMLFPFAFALAELDYFWIANSIYAAFAVSAFVGTAIKLIAYRRGF
jgi:hypothetical protein